MSDCTTPCLTNVRPLSKSRPSIHRWTDGLLGEMTMTSTDCELPDMPDQNRRPWRHYLGLFARGLAMGSADVVPGVSGGTMAFILGIYEDLIANVRMLGRSAFWRPLLRGRWTEAGRAVDIPFLAAVLLGIVIAILTLARLLTWLLENQPVLVWSFFFGLVLASIVVVAQRVRRWRVAHVIGGLIAAAGAFFLVGAVPAHTPDTYWFVFLSGVLAICAMILPGISGAFILVLIGKYEYMLDALNERRLSTIVVFVVGAALGLVSLAQLLGWLFRRFHDATVAVLIGFMAGSLRRLWPWKSDAGTADEANILPSFLVDGAFNLQILYALLLALTGLCVVLMIDRISRRSRRSTMPSTIEDA